MDPCEASDSPPEPLDIDENDLVSINYTSGTTARPKGVMMTHRNCYINAYSLIAHLGVRHDDVELWTLPMFHCNGWGGVYALTGVAGTHVILRSIEAATHLPTDRGRRRDLCLYGPRRAAYDSRL